jgi:NitT/TauT family transport system ATP-binding protein
LKSFELKPFDKKAFYKKCFFTTVGIALIAGVWTVLAHTIFRRNGLVPPPSKAAALILVEMRQKNFGPAIGETLWRSAVSFALAFGAAAFFAVLSNISKPVKQIIAPFIVVCREMPTMAAILILLFLVSGSALPVAVAFLVVFPLCYEQLYSAIENTDGRLLEMAQVFRVPQARQIFGIYLPNVSSAVFSSAIASFGLNIKVVVAAEIMGLPTVSIGYMLMSATQGLDFGAAFAWLVIAVILSFVCECVLRCAARLCMPYVYDDARFLKSSIRTAALRIRRRGACAMKNESIVKSGNSGAVCDTGRAYNNREVRDIRLRGVDFSFGATVVMRDFDGGFERNKIHCIVGPSGCGKTTLLNLAAGLLQPQSGEIHGVSKASYLFQECRLIPQKTVAHNLDFILKTTCPERKARKKVIEDYLALAGLSGARGKYPRELSGGMAQRVALIRAFACRSDVLLMDEPFKALDLQLRRYMTETFLRLWNEDKRTVLFVTHDIDDALTVGDSISVYGDKPLSLLSRFDIATEKSVRRLYDGEIDNIKKKLYAETDKWKTIEKQETQ